MAEDAAVKKAMRGHLSDSELTALVAGARADEALLHATNCSACRKDWRRLHATLTGLAVEIRSEAERSDRFFQLQRGQIARHLGKRPPRWRRWQIVWIPALAAAAFLVVFVTRDGPPPRPRASETDQALLTAVEHSIYTEVPGALRPVALLMAEVEQGLPRTDR